MTTMVVKVESDANIRSLIAAMRLLKGVSEVKRKIEQIPELPYTQQERKS
jgi:hypothetical protein